MEHDSEPHINQYFFLDAVLKYHRRNLEILPRIIE